MNHIGYNTPDLEIHVLTDFLNGEGIVFRFEGDLFPADSYPFYRQLAVDDGDDDIFVPGFEGTIHNQQVAAVNTCPFHRITRHPDKEGGRGVLN